MVVHSNGGEWAAISHRSGSYEGFVVRKVEGYYFERTEELRRTAAKVLKEAGGLTINELHEKLRSFDVPTTRHLAAVLCRDPRKHFRSENKI